MNTREKDLQIQIDDWRDRFEMMERLYLEQVDRCISAESALMQFRQITIAQASRPVYASITDEQLNKIVATLTVYLDEKVRTVN
jgi:hypothetical protein